MNYDGVETASVPSRSAVRHQSGAHRLNRVAEFTNRLADNHRWLLMLVPVYALAVGGATSLRLAVLLAAVILIYNGAMSAAEEHWADWARRYAVCFRSGEIAFIYLALVWLPHASVNSHFYLASFYALLVSLAAIRIGREAVVWTATTAALAVAAYLVVVAYYDPFLVALAGGSYWPSVVLYSVSLWLLYLGIGLSPSVSGDTAGSRVAERTEAGSSPHRKGESAT